MIKRLGLFIITIILSITCLDARIMSDKQILEFIKGMEKYNTYPNISMRKDKRTIVFEVYNVDPDVATKSTPLQIASHHTDNIASIFSSNFISQKNIYHYTTQYGVPATKVVEASPFDFLGLSDDSYRVSLKDNPRALGVDIEINEPRGWKKTEGNNSHTVVHYMTGEGDNQISFMVQVFALPTFISRKEAKDVFSGNPEYGLTKEDLLEDIKGEIIDVKEDVIGLYPALHVRFTQEVIILGQKIPMYTNLWYIMYEDRAIMIWGSAMNPTDFEKGLYDIMFQTMASVIRFPDQFEKKYE